ncbi:MAG: hypothetical protein ACKO5K_03860 [Armatimonadota bacterium]
MERSFRPALLALVATSTVLGCTQPPVRKEDAVSAPSAPASSVPTSAAAGAAAGADDAYAPLTPTPDLDKAIADAAGAKDNKALSDAYAARGAYRTRGDEKAGQRVKYRAALSDFRKALEANPKNADAKAGKNEIEQIYTMMGRPIPTPAECDEVSKTGKYTPKASK